MHCALYLNSMTFTNTGLHMLFRCRRKCEKPRDAGVKCEALRAPLGLTRDVRVQMCQDRGVVGATRGLPGASTFPSQNWGE